MEPHSQEPPSGQQNSSPSEVEINYESRNIDMVYVSHAELELLSQMSMPFQICMGLATTFLGVALGLFATYLTSNPMNKGVVGYAGFSLLVAVGFGYIAWSLNKASGSYKQKILKK